jgi:redox-sensitive bicupin YhaK (pirin superfamily)
VPSQKVIKHAGLRSRLAPSSCLFIREPIAWYGPFVMNTKQEILDAVDDFEAGRMGVITPEHV